MEVKAFRRVSKQCAHAVCSQNAGTSEVEEQAGVFRPYGSRSRVTVGLSDVVVSILLTLNSEL